MAIIVGDIHGNVEKVRVFLQYKPEEEHVALGDYLDSFYEPQNRQLMALQLLLDSKTVLLWGNHDLHYLFPIAPFISTGFQYGKEDKYFDVITANKDRFLAAYTVDGWLCTHAGCHIRLAKHKTDVVQIATMLNKEMTEYLAHPYVRPEGIFAIGLGRGGNNRIGGIFWFDFKRETGLADCKQIFGHTETKEPVITDNYVALDTTNCKSEVYLFDTAENKLVRISVLPGGNSIIKTDSKGRSWDAEQVRLDNIEFALEHPKHAIFPLTKDDMKFFHLHRPERELEIRIKNNPRMRDLSVEEQAPFGEWMMGQTRPFIEGIAREDQDFFYEHDYRRWKAGLQNFDHDLSKVYRKELLDLRREVKSLLGKPKKETAWFAEYNFHPDDVYSMSYKDLCKKIEVFKGLVKQLEAAKVGENDVMNLWGFCDSSHLVIVDAKSAGEAFQKAEKFWYVGQTITPLGVLPLNAPDLINKPIYKFDRFFWKGFDCFFELLK